MASIAIGDLAGVQTVTRKVTNVGDQAETYTASYTGLAGITVALPASFSIAKGATKSFNVTFTTAGAALNTYVGGQFTLTGDKGHVVRIPVVIRPVALAAPTQVSGSYNVTFGYTGPFTATARGLVPAAVSPGTVADDPTDSTCSLDLAERAADPGHDSGRHDVRALLAVRRRRQAPAATSTCASSRAPRWLAAVARGPRLRK